MRVLIVEDESDLAAALRLGLRREGYAVDVVTDGATALEYLGHTPYDIVCLDVGLTRTDEGIRGDIDPSVAEVAGFLTPMPGGTGPMTIAMLLQSTLKAARYRRGLLAFPGS